MTELVEKLHAIDQALTAAGLRHAFGGAIALAYCVDEPRGTRDLDVNVFVPAERAEEVLASLPDGVNTEQPDLDRLLRDAQTRLWWGTVPVDLFLNNLPVHDEVSAEIRWVPLEGREIPVLSCESLVLFKAFFNRTKDWADIEAIAGLDPEILRRAASRVASLVGEEDEFTVKLRSLAG
jgi:pimeloyl-ACP methyl ester carboxylesterase